MFKPTSERKRKRKRKRNNVNGLIIFVKNPELGKVKTRIAKDAGDDKALEIYKKLLGYTQGISSALPVKRYVFYGDYIQSQDLWSSKSYEKYAQEKGDLGLRMYAAFEKIASKSKKMLLIGSDCTQISSSTLIKAYTVLDKKDVVIGTTLDGGYYLIGMKIFQRL
mgnify:CR=1 FL=1